MRPESPQTMNEDDLAALMALSEVKGLGNKRIIKLLERFQSVESIFEADRHRFSDIGFVNDDVYGRIQDASPSATKYFDIIEECEQNEIEVISYLDSRYPGRLKQEKVAPLLFVKGDIKIASKPCISIVGSRESSAESRDWAYEVARTLSNEGYVIVSGGALGIDSAAHEGALAGSGETISVLGSGIENVYPPENKDMIESISNTGLVVSARYPQQGVNRYSLLDRNKITSGLSDSLLIVTSTGEGGTSSQYQDAKSQGKRLLCPALELGLEPSEGIESMLNEGEVRTVQSIQDIMTILGSEGKQMSFDEL